MKNHTAAILLRKLVQMLPQAMIIFLKVRNHYYFYVYLVTIYRNTVVKYVQLGHHLMNLIRSFGEKS